MSEAKKKRPLITSPKGVLRYPKITEPDYGTKEYPKPDGQYKTGIIYQLDSPGAKKLIHDLTPHYKEMQAWAEEEFKKLPVGTRKAFEKKNIKGPQFNPLFTEVYDKETEEPTGEIVFNVAAKASGERKTGPKKGTRWTFKPTIYDAHKNRIAKVPDIWGGTVARVAFEVSPYFVAGTAAAGLKLNLVGVQIIDLVSGGERSAESLGFEDEDGYAHQDAGDETEATGNDETAEGEVDPEDADF